MGQTWLALISLEFNPTREQCNVECLVIYLWMTYEGFRQQCNNLPGWGPQLQLCRDSGAHPSLGVSQIEGIDTGASAMFNARQG